ncbi:family 20 glycosylhydrolase [Catenulispora sp. NF23]|uniref:Family 20 glycosylhydrolase n=1 Tax=Catenulispora pinistramenti TaxID=2705254 RepID=A0ABS5KJ71_9ACTN|nr:family 20 glycosylhydrolase [Catenulispora pinistramenti]MBS2532225.1 family 20 glycosylhydrolase [Catenulispora pinistramenti]MBS2546374.1 family 20 glycosylhydrolase [Catenulispora pinistramenti]
MTTTERDSAPTAPPATLPAIQQWTPGSGPGFGWQPSGRILVDPSFASALTTDAQTFADDVGMVLNAPAPAVVTGALAAGAAGDIHISLASTDPQLGTEGYELTIGPILQIGAGSAAGAFWATRTIIQMIRQSVTLPAGTVRDWPLYPVRSVLVDNGSRPFPIGFWHNEIRELSYLKLNELMLYVSGLNLTDAQIQQLGAFAEAYHVNLVGQVNMPGHMDTAHEGIPPEYELTDSTGAPILGALDLTNPTAVAWARQLAAHYLGLMSAPVWHTGGDEYAFYNKKMNDPADMPKLVQYAQSQYGPNGTIEDVYRAFMNETDAIVRQQGKALRMWNDDLFATATVPLNSDITIEYWLSGGSMSPAEHAANGNLLINANAATLYFDENAPGAANTTGQIIWEDFDPAVFEGNQRLPGGATDPHLVGVKLSSWDATQESVGALERDLQPLQEALAQRAWGSPKLYPTWAQMASTVTAVGKAPGFFDTPAAGDPGAGSLPGSQAEVYDDALGTFTVQPDGSLLHTYYIYDPPGSYKTEVVAPAGSAAGRPAAFGSGNQQHVFARGADGHLLQWVTGTAFGGWGLVDWTAEAAAQGGPSLDLAGDPAGFVFGTTQHVFGRGSDGRIHHWWYTDADNTTRADDWGGPITGNPAAVAFGDVQNVFARGVDGLLHHWWWQGSEPIYEHHEIWFGPLPAPDASPIALDYAETEIHVFARDTEGHLQHWWFDDVAGQTNVEDWTAATGYSIAGDPSGFVYGDQQHTFFRDAATNQLDHVWSTHGLGLGHEDWSTEAPGGVVALAGDPWSCNVFNAEQHAFGPDSAGHVHHWFWRQSDGSVHQDTWQQ